MMNLVVKKLQLLLGYQKNIIRFENYFIKRFELQFQNAIK